MTASRNPLVRLIESGRVSTNAQLRSAYRTLVLKTHPDAVGSDRLLDRYLALSADYEEARRLLPEPARSPARPTAGSPASPPAVPPENHRLSYYRALRGLERIDKAYTFHRQRNLARIAELKGAARAAFAAWNPASLALYDAADRDYDRIKSEKPVGPYLNDALALNVGPVFHNILAFHLTGSSFYRQQVRQNLQAVLQKLARHGCDALRGFLEILIDDMKDGAALFDERVGRVTRLPGPGRPR